MNSWEKTTWFHRFFQRRNKWIVVGVLAAMLVAIAVAVLVFVLQDNGKDVDTDAQNHTQVEDTDTEKQPEETAQQEDPQNIIIEETQEEIGEEVDVTEVVDPNRTGEITYGIDVSRYQGTISWKKVAQAGVDFAMVRVGYRTLKTGDIVADSNAKYNMQEAQKYGVKVGVYFFSTAITKTEAIEEANWVADYIAKYQITYPVAFNCEGFEHAENRQYSLTKTQRTDLALAFLGQIVERNYSPLFYAAKDEMEADAKWEMSRIASLYNVWVAQYPSVAYPETTKSTYTGSHVMWQYTNRGVVPGISGAVDMNIAYFGFVNSEGPQDTDNPEQVEADPEALMNFQSVKETVTAKNKTNLRDKPSQGADSTVKYTLKNGETATRTGISSTGWSRVVWKGKTYYAVSSYLTTDLEYAPPQEEPDDGIKTVFTATNDQVTPKDAVNLRKKPSTDDSIAPVVVKIQKGEVVTRTGINTDVGWSRVVYNGQTLYCISSYLEKVE